MYKNILVPIAFDHDEGVPETLDIARAIAAEGAKITAFHVVDAVPSYVSQYLPADHAESAVATAKAELERVLGDAGDVSAVAVNGHSGRTIVDYAEAEGIDCIVVHSHRPGFQDYFLGSTAAWVVRHASCSVHVRR